MREKEYKYDVFLSHAGEDDQFVKRLADDLERKGTTVFEDSRSIKPGEHITVAVNKALKSSRKLVFIMSKASIKKKWPQAESLYITYFDPTGEERKLIPILIEDCDPPELIKPIKRIDFRNSEDYSIRFRELVEALDIALPTFDSKEKELLTFEEREIRGREAYRRGKTFENEVAALYKLLGFDVGESQKLMAFKLISLSISDEVYLLMQK